MRPTGALQYVMIDILIRYGQELGCGAKVDLEAVGEDARDPSAFIGSTERRSHALRSVR